MTGSGLSVSDDARITGRRLILVRPPPLADMSRLGVLRRFLARPGCYALRCRWIDEARSWRSTSVSSDRSEFGKGADQPLRGRRLYREPAKYDDYVAATEVCPTMARRNR
jgi:hypothetical protein